MKPHLVKLFVLSVLCSLLAWPSAAHASTLTNGTVYTLRSACSEKLLDVKGADTADGAAVHVWEPNGGTHQQWKLLDAGNGYYALIAQHSGKSLDVREWGTQDGTAVQQWSYNSGQTNQTWRITAVGSGFYTLIDRNSGKALDVNGAGTTNGTQVQIWSNNNSCAQQWQFTTVSNNGIQARAAADFYDSLGVGITIANYTSEEGYQTVTKPAVQELGIKHLRIGLDIYPDSVSTSAMYTRCRDLASLGYRFNAIAGSLPTNWNGYTPSVVSKIPDAFDWCGGAIETLEGINEPNLQNVPDWVTQTRQFQRELYEVVTSTPKLAGVKVVGPSPVLIFPNAGAELGDISAWTDYGNMHSYYGNRNPGTRGWGGQFFGAAYGSLEYQLGYSAQNTKNQLVFATETGYSTNQDDNGIALPEDVKAQYILRTYLHHFAKGVPRTFVYVLVSGDPNKPKDYESHFGLVTNDGTRLPSFKLLTRLVNVVQGASADSSALSNQIFLPLQIAGGTSSFAPGSLDYTISGSTDNVEHLLLQRPDGHFLLPIWLEVPAWNDDTRSRVTVTPQPVSVSLPQNISQVRLLTFKGDGTITTQSLSPQNGTVSISLGAEVQLLEVW